MFRPSLVAAALIAAIVAAPTLQAPAAMAETPKCKTKANKHVACTDKLKATTPRRASDVDGRDFLTWQRGHSAGQRAKAPRTMPLWGFRARNRL